jgi:hypothetical protein
METLDGKATFYAASIEEWRIESNENCRIDKLIWLIVYH